MDLLSTLSHLSRGGVLDEDAATALFSRLLAGEMTPAQIGAALGMLALRGVSCDELVGAARVMRAHVTRVPRPDRCPPLVDTCGTGGAPKAFNVSTLAAITAAAAAPGRIAVAKHGGRSRTGRGSAELLGALGVNVDADPAAQSRCLAGAGVCFCFAIHHHPAMRHAGPARRELGFATVLNLLGPLTNPADAEHQVLGVFSADAAPLVARALARLGSARAMVVHSQDGLDEITVTAPTRVWHVERAEVRESIIEPLDLGIARAPLEALTVPDLHGAVAAARAILDGAPSPGAEMVALNAGAALLVAGACADITTGLALARDALRSGRARETLTRLADLSRTEPSTA